MYNLIFISFVLLSCGDDSSVPQDVLPKISAQGITILEGNVDSKIVVDFRLDKAAEDVVTAVIHTEDGTATSGEDYVPIVGQSIVFQPGDVRTSHPVSIKGDEKIEEDEYFTIIVSDVEGAAFNGSGIELVLENDDLDTVFNIPAGGYTTPDSYDGMISLWSDEFNGTKLNDEYWTHEIGNGNNGWGNNELQYYRAENTLFKEGNLVIDARKESFAGFSYTSSRIITRNKFKFRFGRIDVRAALPEGRGLWPAIWMLGSNFGSVGWPACGEIDIMEKIGGQGNELSVHGTTHWSAGGSHASSSGEYKLSSGSFKDEFHVFSVVWDETSITWYTDDIKYHEMDITSSDVNEFQNDHFIILNVAVGGDWPGSPDGTTIFPQRMILDYVRVFQKEE